MTVEEQQFEKIKLEPLLKSFTYHNCMYNKTRIEVGDTIRKLCHHQLQVWHKKMSDEANKFFKSAIEKY